MTLERRWSDPNDRARAVPDSQRAADGRGILSEPAAPESIADGGSAAARRGSANLVVLLGEEPPHVRREAEHSEVAAGDKAGTQVNRNRFVLEGRFQVRQVVGGEQTQQRRLARAELFIDRIEQDESLAA